MEFLPQHESARGKVNYEGLAEAFNARVRLLPLSNLRLLPRPAAMTVMTPLLSYRLMHTDLQTAKYVHSTVAY